MTKDFHILLLNGPNLNMLGTREPSFYGGLTLQDIVNQTSQKAKQLGVKLSHFQSNAEHELINKIHQAQGKVDFILINPAALTHTSVALRDAILSVAIPFYEIHLTNIYAREPFRHHSYLSDIANGVICGFRADSYIFALEAAVKFLIRVEELDADGEPKSNKCKE
ncbi:type II 3-dehydroquinate dehydratase [Arsenophonus nasoniae]|uniref:3-dehydroquinate dehydratase n=1 Tax=Arsenophonus nasoniae TaxID=638 RepID=A0AA95GQY8_9GAMM|nr:type II 3-dehydroquinate dehydratase [Arsenophonus nasoniae]WGL95716.1 type II 3-dehydroquinate dehydratase [Arsenophonus nasoniae]WGM01335.1 type II 3-dehydroquinate dehydratase [Arsenophonus nasoniae]